MEEHLLEEINYEDVAKQVHTSSYEFHRAFSFVTGLTANTYIRNRRLSLAARELVETDAKITKRRRALPRLSPGFTGSHRERPEKKPASSCSLILLLSHYP